MYYYLLKLPKDLTSLEGFSFEEEQVQNNRLWKLESSEIFLHTCEKPYTSIVANYRGKDVIDFKHIHLSNKSMALLTEYFLKEGKLASVEFSGDLDNVSNLELIPDLRRKALKKELSLEDIEKGCSSLKWLLEEGYYQINWITVAIHMGDKFREVKINTASTFGLIGSKFEGVEENITSLIQETIGVLGGTKGLSFSPVYLPVHETVAHPLARSVEVLNKLYENSGETVRLDLGIPVDEWSLIKADLEKHADAGKDKVLYRHLADNLVKSLVN